MRLYLVQHAEAKREEEDPARSLSQNGREDIGRIATYVDYHADIKVEQIVHSGKTRARQTAEILSDHLKPTKGVNQVDNLEPGADAEIWGKRIERSSEDLMLVGHLPHLSNLAAYLIRGVEGSTPIEFRMGCITCLSRKGDGAWSVNWMLIPEIVE